ncbi:unnamed protein product [Closterium sp. NIES-54]
MHPIGLDASGAAGVRGANHDHTARPLHSVEKALLPLEHARCDQGAEPGAPERAPAADSQAPGPSAPAATTANTAATAAAAPTATATAATATAAPTAATATTATAATSAPACSATMASFRVLGEAEIYAGAMAAQELRWLTYLLTDLGEHPCSPPVLYVDYKAMIALC